MEFYCLLFCYLSLKYLRRSLGSAHAAPDSESGPPMHFFFFSFNSNANKQVNHLLEYKN